MKRLTKRTFCGLVFGLGLCVAVALADDGKLKPVPDTGEQKEALAGCKCPYVEMMPGYWYGEIFDDGCVNPRQIGLQGSYSSQTCSPVCSCSGRLGSGADRPPGPPIPHHTSPDLPAGSSHTKHSFIRLTNVDNKIVKLFFVRFKKDRVDKELLMGVECTAPPSGTRVFDHVAKDPDSSMPYFRIVETVAGPALVLLCDK